MEMIWVQYGCQTQREKSLVQNSNKVQRLIKFLMTSEIACHINLKGTIQLLLPKNFQNEFGLDEVHRHSNDQDSVSSWIKEWENHDENPIVYYKLQGVADFSGQLKEEDVMAIMQSPLQKYILEKFGHEGICCDATHGTTGYDFKLTSLLVVDDFGTGFPVAWCLYNHEDFNSMEVFLGKLKEANGQSINRVLFNEHQHSNTLISIYYSLQGFLSLIHPVCYFNNF